MSFDIYVKSSELLEKLANSLYDRDPKRLENLFFSIAEIQLVEKWLIEILHEAIKKPASFNGLLKLNGN